MTEPAQRAESVKILWRKKTFMIRKRKCDKKKNSGEKQIVVKFCVVEIN